MCRKYGRQDVVLLILIETVLLLKLKMLLVLDDNISRFENKISLVAVHYKKTNNSSPCWQKKYCEINQMNEIYSLLIKNKQFRNYLSMLKGWELVFIIFCNCQRTGWAVVR